MTSTAGSIEKMMERAMKSLDPETLARYVTEETENAITRQLAGDDASNELRRIDEAVEKYAPELDYPDYLKFWGAMWKEERRRFIRFILKFNVPALDRERSFNALLVIAGFREWYSLEGKNDEKSENSRIKIRERISQYLTGYREISTLIESILADDIWELEGVPRPIISEIQGLAQIMEEAEEIVSNSNRTKEE